MAATKIIVNLMDATGSKLKVDQVGLLDVKKDNGGSVDATDLDNGTVYYSEKNLVGNLRNQVSGTSVLDGGIDGRVVIDGSLSDLVVRDEKIGDNIGGGGEGWIEQGRINLNVDVNREGRGVGRWNGERLEDQNHGFRVGDLVWAKIKSHPWWPGQVHDPMNASEFALKHSVEGRILVAFSGDGSCSWCLPTQLIPFVPNLEEMSAGSSSKSFVNAVQRVVDEIGRIVESKITCKCIPQEKRDRLARPVVANAGVRAGVLAPEVDTDRLLVPDYEPAEILAKLTDFAKGVSMVRVIDVIILRSWLSAYYIAKCGCQLSAYSEPFRVEGLEGKNNENTVHNAIEVDGSNSSSRVSSAQSQEPSDDEDYELMDKKKIAMADVEIGASKGGSSTGKRGRKSSDESAESEDTPRLRVRKKSKFLSPPYTNLVGKIGSSKSVYTVGKNSSSDSDEEKLSFHESVIDIEVNELLQKLEFAAVDIFYLKKEGYLDSTWAFISAHRSSAYVFGSDNKIHHKCKRVGHKRKSLASQSEEIGMDDLISDARSIRRKLGKMSGILEKCCSRFSSDEKSCLKHEMELLMEDAETTSGKVR